MTTIIPAPDPIIKYIECNESNLWLSELFLGCTRMCVMAKVALCICPGNDTLVRNVPPLYFIEVELIVSVQLYLQPHISVCFAIIQSL